MKKKKFKSPAWILAFSVGQYLAFFTSLIATSVMFYLGLKPIAWVLLKISIVLAQPFFNSLTNDFIMEHLPGPKAHIVFVLNALVWGIVIWGIIQIINRNKSEPEH